jgi:hypothetical protein
MFDDEIFKVMLQDLYIHPALSILAAGLRDDRVQRSDM